MSLMGQKLHGTMKRYGLTLVKHRKKILGVTALLVTAGVGSYYTPWVASFSLFGAGAFYSFQQGYEGRLILCVMAGLLSAIGLPSAGKDDTTKAQALAFEQSVEAAFRNDTPQPLTLSFKSFALDWGRKERSVTFESRVVCSNDDNTIKVIETRQTDEKNLLGPDEQYKKVISSSYTRVSPRASWQRVNYSNGQQIGKLDCK